MLAHSLVTTERRLILLFVCGALVFLVSFEAIFLLTRNIQEDQYQKASFEREVAQINERAESGNTRSGAPL